MVVRLAMNLYHSHSNAGPVDFRIAQVASRAKRSHGIPLLAEVAHLHANSIDVHASEGAEYDHVALHHAGAVADRVAREAGQALASGAVEAITTGIDHHADAILGIGSVAALNTDAVGEVLTVGVLVAEGAGDTDRDNEGVEDAPVGALEEADGVALGV